MDKWLTWPRVVISYLLLPIIFAVMGTIVGHPFIHPSLYLFVFLGVTTGSAVIAGIMGWLCTHKWGKPVFFRAFHISFIAVWLVVSGSWFIWFYFDLQNVVLDLGPMFEPRAPSPP